MNQGSANVVSVSGLPGYYNRLAAAGGIDSEVKEGQVFPFFSCEVAGQEVCSGKSISDGNYVYTSTSGEAVEREKRGRDGLKLR